MGDIIKVLGESGIVLVMVFLVYWVMEWIKLVLKDKIQEIYVQPISLVIGTVITSGIMWGYGFTPLNLGDAKYEWINYLVQGSLLTALTGVIYDKFLDPDLRN